LVDAAKEISVEPLDLIAAGAGYLLEIITPTHRNQGRQVYVAGTDPNVGTVIRPVIDWNYYEELPKYCRVPGEYLTACVLANGETVEVSSLFSLWTEQEALDPHRGESYGRGNCWELLRPIPINMQTLLVRRDALAAYIAKTVSTEGVSESPQEEPESPQEEPASPNPGNRPGELKDDERRRRDATLGLLAKMYCEAATSGSACPRSKFFKENGKPLVSSVTSAIMDRLKKATGSEKVKKGYADSSLRKRLAYGWPLEGEEPETILIGVLDVLSKDLESAIRIADVEEGIIEPNETSPLMQK
jgi:hypothetical protein